MRLFRFRIIKLYYSWEINTGKIDPNSFDSGGYISRSEDLKVYREQKAKARKKWQMYEEAHRVVSNGYQRWRRLKDNPKDPRTPDDTRFLEEYDGYDTDTWTETLENADSKSQSALSKFEKVNLKRVLIVKPKRCSYWYTYKVFLLN